MKPGARPLEALAALIAPHLPDDKSQALRLLQWQDDLRQDERTLHAAVRLATTKASSERFLIVIDQFEEIFTNLAYELPRILQETQKPLEIQAQIAQVLIDNLTQVTNLANLANLKLRYLRELATCYRLLGSTLYELDELAKAQDAFSESAKLCEELVKRVPTEPFWQRDLAVSHYHLGRIWQQKGNKRKACQAYKVGWAAATKAVDLGYTNPDLKTLLASSETTMQQLGCR